MRFYRPFVEVPGDSEDRIMARTGEIVGYDPNENKCLWRFGYLPESQAAEAYMVSLPQYTTGGPKLACAGFLWVLATRDGTALDTFTGYGTNLPKEYEHVIQIGEPTDDDELQEADPYAV